MCRVSTENLALVEQGYEAFSKGEIDRLRELWAPDLVWRTPGYGVLRREYRGIDQVMGYLMGLAELTGGTFHSEPEAMFDNEDMVVSLDHITGSRNGKVLDAHVVHVYRIRDGKLVEATDYAAEPHRGEEFWA